MRLLKDQALMGLKNKAQNMAGEFYVEIPQEI
jgi:hypothetical protein